MSDVGAGVLIAAVIGLAAGAIAIVISRRRRAPQRRLHEFIDGISHDWVCKCILPDGIGGEIFVDYLLLTDRGLVVLECKNVTGTVFAGDRLDTWNATASGGRIEFDNPVPALLNRIAAVEKLAPGLPVLGRILFTAPVTFPKGHPGTVATFESIAQEFAARREYDPAFEPAWVGLKAQASFT